MNISVVCVALLLICVGVCAIIEQVKRMFFKPFGPETIYISNLGAQDAEYRLRSAIFLAKGRNCVIRVVCKDEEAYQICRILAAENENCMICLSKKAD